MDAAPTLSRLQANVESERCRDSVALYARFAFGLFELRIDGATGKRHAIAYPVRRLRSDIRGETRQSTARFDGMGSDRSEFAGLSEFQDHSGYLQVSNLCV